MKATTPIKKISEMNLKGIYLVNDNLRVYPYKEYIAPILGFVGIDNDGFAGLEYYYNDYLKGFQHIKGTINFGCSFIGFNTNKDYGRSGNVKLIGHLALDSFRGNKFLSFNVIEVESINN